MFAHPRTGTEALLGSTLKIRTLRVLSRYPTREFTTRELAGEAGASDVGVGKALDDLEAYDVVRRRRIGRAYAVRANPGSALFQAARELFGREEERGARFRRAVQRWCARENVEYAALFGSAARGEMGPDSDVDLLVVSRTPKAVFDALADLAEETRRLVGRPLSPLVLDPEEFRKARSSSLGEGLRREGIPLYARKGRR
ncbi:MAG TPA: nucleotidyltransferase domain-containing protein [Thermoplasmata archaeon]